MSPSRSSDPSPWPSDAQVGRSLPDLMAYLVWTAHGLPPSPSALQAWDWFVQTCEPRIRQVARGCGVPPADLDDCVQATWIRLVHALGHGGYDPQHGRFRGWLSTLVRHTAANQVEVRRRHPPEPLDDDEAAALLGHEPDPAAEYERQQRIELLRRVLSQLRDRVPPLSFQVFHLHWIESQTFAQVAAVLDLTADQARSRHHQRMTQFRRLVERHRPDLAPPE